MKSQQKISRLLIVFVVLLMNGIVGEIIQNNISPILKTNDKVILKFMIDKLTDANLVLWWKRSASYNS